MKITVLLESLGSGGAERQGCGLAKAFTERGHSVRIATYAAGDFYLPLLQSANIPHDHLKGRSRLERIRSVRRYLRSADQDAVLAFLEGPCTYAELASLPCRNWGLVVSERVAIPDSHKRRLDVRKYLHLAADFVTTNSHANRLMLERAVPRLRGRIATIYNAVDLIRFHPVETVSARPALRFVVAASYQARKNTIGLIKAVSLLASASAAPAIEVDWYGDIAGDPAYFETAQRAISDLGLGGIFRLHPATSSIIDNYCDSDAVILPSFFEGLPNAVCEAMACGRPVLMSGVCDAGNLAKDGVNGFLFDPLSPQSIADAISRFASLDPQRRRELGKASRLMAESLFDASTIADLYLDIVKAAAARQRISLRHSIPDVPATALAMLDET